MQQKIDTPRCLDFFLRAQSHQVECDERGIHDLGFSDPSISDRTLLWEGILNAQQSAVEFQYAWELEQAITIGGSQPLAEARLGRPCRHLEGYVPWTWSRARVASQPLSRICKEWSWVPINKGFIRALLIAAVLTQTLVVLARELVHIWVAPCTGMEKSIKLLAIYRADIY